MKNKRIIQLVNSEPWAMSQEAFDSLLSFLEEDSELDSSLFHAQDLPVGGNEGRHDLYAFKDGIATINVFGPVVARGGGISNISALTTTEGIGKALRAAQENQEVKSIAMVFDTPGGSSTGSVELADEIFTSPKPVHGYVVGMCASLGYLWGSACKSLSAGPMAIVGSIGVVAAMPKTDEEAKKRQVVSSQTPHKRDDSRGSMQVLVDSMADVFIDRVAAYRGVSSATVKETFGKGGVFVAGKALELGMIDNVKSLGTEFKTVAGFQPPTMKEHEMPTYEEGFAAGLAQQKSAHEKQLKAALVCMEGNYADPLKAQAIRVLKGELSADVMECLLTMADVQASSDALAEADKDSKTHDFKAEAPKGEEPAAPKAMTEEDFLADAKATAERMVL